MLRGPQVDARSECIDVAVDDFMATKSNHSERTIPLASSIMAEVARLRPAATGLFVIESPYPPPPFGIRDRRCRCRDVFGRLISWLRVNGVNGNKPLHELRKEFGSIVARKSDLFTASRMLGHANLDVTQHFYTESRNRVVVDPLILLQVSKLARPLNRGFATQDRDGL